MTTREQFRDIVPVDYRTYNKWKKKIKVTEVINVLNDDNLTLLEKRNYVTGLNLKINEKEKLWDKFIGDDL